MPLYLTKSCLELLMWLLQGKLSNMVSISIREHESLRKSSVKESFRKEKFKLNFRFFF